MWTTSMWSRRVVMIGVTVSVGGPTICAVVLGLLYEAR